MAETSGLTFAPTLHNVTPERVVFVYNVNKTGSLEVARYYRDKRGIPNNNLLGLPLPIPEPGATSADCETTVLTATDYLYLIELPLINHMEGLGTDFSSDGVKPIWVIILGYGIPTAMDDNGSIVAVASKLHRIGKDNTLQVPNHTFDRRNFQFFDDDDASEMFITAILDGPTVASVKKLIDRSLDVDNQSFITGKIYVDPYGQKSLADDLEYQEDILDFITSDIPNLSMDSVVTVDIDDPYQEPTISNLAQDAFYWGWFNPTFSKNLFANQNERRVFLFNADDRAACNIHFFDVANDSPFDENGSDPWCNLAINVEPGYAACGGAVADPGSDAQLRPGAFFRALHQGASLGEAFLFASKFISWRIVLIGDPLMVVNFPVDIPSDQDPTFTLIPNDEVIRLTKFAIEDSLGWGSRQNRILKNTLDRIVASDDLDEEIPLLNPISVWSTNKNQTAQEDIHFGITSTWLQYIQQTTNTTVSEWLTNKGERITNPLRSIIQQTGTTAVEDSLVYPTGWWSFTFSYEHPILTLENIFFRLEVARDSAFSSIVLDTSTTTDTIGWKYEASPYIFVQLPGDGFPSNFSGRRIRFESPTDNLLRSTEIYHVRWTPTNASGTPFLVVSQVQEMVIAN